MIENTKRVQLAGAAMLLTVAAILVTIRALLPIESLLLSPDLERDLHGVVVTPAGEPIRGAELRVSCPASRRVPMIGGSPLEERRVVSLRTNALGEFLIPLEPGRAYDLAATAAGRARRRLTDLHAGESLVVELEAEAQLVGRVTLLESGAPLSGVEIRLRAGTTGSAEGTEHAATTDAEGEFRLEELPADVFRVSVLSEHHPRIDQRVVLGPGEVRRLDVALERGTTIRGRVTSRKTGRPLAGARVGLGWKMRHGTITDARGRYLIDGVAPGASVQVHAEAPGHGRWEVTIPSVPGEGSERSFGLLPGRVARGRLVDSAGAPVSGALVSAESRRYSRLDARRGRSDAEGCFQLEDLRPDGRHTLMIRAEGLATAVYDFPAWERRSTVIEFGEIRLAPPGGLQGRLIGPDGAPLRELQVWLTALGADRDRFRPEVEGGASQGYVTVAGLGTGPVVARTDDRGRFLFEGLPAGLHRLRAGGRGVARRTELCLELGEGEVRDDLELVLDLDFAIEGELVDAEGYPLAGLEVHVYAANRSASHVSTHRRITSVATGADGSFALRGLDPAAYDLETRAETSWARDGTRLELDATRWLGIEAGAQELRLVVSGGAHVAGRIVGPAGEPVPGCLVYIVEGGRRRGIRAADEEGRFCIQVPQGSPVIIGATPVPELDSLTPIAEEADLLDQHYSVTSTGVSPGTSGLVLRLPRLP